MPKQITDAELEVMKVLWQADEPVTSGDICEALPENNWAYTTVATLLSRLTEKGAVAFKKNGKTKYYTAMIKEGDYQAEQTRHLVLKLYNGSVKNLVANLIESNDISKEDIEEIKKLFNL